MLGRAVEEQALWEALCAIDAATSADDVCSLMEIGDDGMTNADAELISAEAPRIHKAVLFILKDIV